MATLTGPAREHEIARVVMRTPYLLLDAGGTLVCPNADRFVDAGRTLGYSLDASRLITSFFTRVHRYDTQLREAGRDANVDSFLLEVLVDAGVDEGDATDVLERATRASSPQSLWTYALPGVERALGDLHAGGFGISVVSNSDGTVVQQMNDLGLARYFERVFDSRTLGVAKPDPRIFERVLSEVDRTPDACLYVGDVVMIDAVSANACRMRAVHLDPLGLYRDWPGLHTRDLPTLARMLLNGKLDLDDPRLFGFA